MRMSALSTRTGIDRKLGLCDCCCRKQGPLQIGIIQSSTMRSGAVLVRRYSMAWSPSAACATR